MQRKVEILLESELTVKVKELTAILKGIDADTSKKIVDHAPDLSKSLCALKKQMYEWGFLGEEN